MPNHHKELFFSISTFFCKFICFLALFLFKKYQICNFNVAMKNFLRTDRSIIFAVILLALALSNCRKKEEDKPNTDPVAPTAYTSNASYISQTWATFNGIVNAGNQLTTISFEYDTDSAFTNILTISAYPDTLTGNTSTNRTANITGLTPNTTYYYRTKAVNPSGESYGVRYEFTTLEEEISDIKFGFVPYGEVKDIEDNVYKTLKIGEQTWMAQNLAVTKYNDGEPIPLVVTSSIWANTDTLEKAAYSWYGNIEVKYGALYNWYAVNSEKLCPDGWRVPTNDDWAILIDTLGGATVAGGKLKEAAYWHWAPPNVSGSNLSGFTALPGGYRSPNGASYNALTKYGYWWTSSEVNSKTGIGHSLHYNYADIDEINIDKRAGASVRCIKK